MRAAYVCHPVRGDVAGNRAKALEWVKRLQIKFPDMAVCANWLYEIEIWDDDDEAQRAAGIARNKHFIGLCEDLILCGDTISPGMQEECDHALALGKTIYRARNGKDGSVQLTRHAMTLNA